MGFGFLICAIGRLDLFFAVLFHLLRGAQFFAMGMLKSLRHVRQSIQCLDITALHFLISMLFGLIHRVYSLVGFETAALIYICALTKFYFILVHSEELGPKLVKEVYLFLWVIKGLSGRYRS